MNNRWQRVPIRAVGIAVLGIALGAAQAQDKDKDGATTPVAAAPTDMPAWVRRGLPGPGHLALAPLAGTWRVQMGVYATLGRREDAPPITSDDIVTRRQWVAGGRYLEDTTEGTLMKSRYWRRGWLGYDNMAARYEWVTIDETNAGMMRYASQSGSVPGTRIDLFGTFVDQGVAGEDFVGKVVPMRTVIHIENQDRHVIELYFTPPGRKEALATRAVYTRTAP
ncbi:MULTISPECIES: DUF1579 family protein [unclassified Rhizobacter]|uniref:DUF1579 family protein n=1 Tax=unclassified Rhizobacter TaxID=2640088 RepID=UPI0006F29DE9|nr:MULTISPECIES: DUF1579 family protein [unclassified Rhizobacter]KQU80659.1 hypothetical protein ASC88_13875 [Rhizobacter sp. Root29]KQW09663.1 hypothetical protein ASC98_23455 [Rhizobacter sp. Root1238]KRB14674.1 hypothetical protein ASE08_09615 [Rhizobacter sp. Root16D2]